MNALLAIPKADVSVRDATLDDVAFIDALQKRHADRVGFMRTSWIEGKIRKREVIVAEDATGERIGYCMGVDRYFKRDDVGIIHQMNVVPGKQRGFVGATLLRAMFDRAAYGCRLFCCWCAQDIEANHFWESMGFVPLAYRAGSEKKRKGGRVHIFWQKRIREGDNETPWWFPCATTAGAMNADRLVLPIPPGRHWSDEMPVILPGAAAAVEEPKRLPGPRERKGPAKLATGRVLTTAAIGMRFAPLAPSGPAKAEKKPREKKPRAKNDPALVAAARELRDRYLEHVNSRGAGGMTLEGAGKYDVTRCALPPAPTAEELKSLPHAA
jgi:N-acetylglutamate synthase-like GNAT family acetyltransferase